MDIDNYQRQAYLQEQLSHTLDSINEVHTTFANDLTVDDKKQIKKSQQERLLNMFKIQQMCQRKRYLEEQLSLNLKKDQIANIKAKISEVKIMDANTDSISNYFYYSEIKKRNGGDRGLVSNQNTKNERTLVEKCKCALGNSASMGDPVSDVYLTDRFNVAFSKIDRDTGIFQSLLR